MNFKKKNPILKHFSKNPIKLFVDFQLISNRIQKLKNDEKNNRTIHDYHRWRHAGTWRP